MAEFVFNLRLKHNEKLDILLEASKALDSWQHLTFGQEFIDLFESVLNNHLFHLNNE